MLTFDYCLHYLLAVVKGTYSSLLKCSLCSIHVRTAQDGGSTGGQRAGQRSVGTTPLVLPCFSTAKQTMSINVERKKKEGEQIPSPSPNPLCEASRGRFSPLEGKHDMASEYGLANNGQNTITPLLLVPLIGNAIETRWAKKRECLTSMFQSFETVSSKLIFPRPGYVKQL